MGFKRFNEGIFQNAIANQRLKKLLLGIYHVCEFSVGVIKELGDINIIVHMAAETRVDISMKTPVPARLRNNII